MAFVEFLSSSSVNKSVPIKEYKSWQKTSIAEKFFAFFPEFVFVLVLMDTNVFKTSLKKSLKSCWQRLHTLSLFSSLSSYFWSHFLRSNIFLTLIWMKKLLDWQQRQQIQAFHTKWTRISPNCLGLKLGT